jgi:hypothetical protein
MSPRSKVTGKHVFLYWADIIRKPHSCLIRATGSHELIFSGLESQRLQVEGFQVGENQRVL